MEFATPSLWILYSTHVGVFLSLTAIGYSFRNRLMSFFAQWREHSRLHSAKNLYRDHELMLMSGSASLFALILLLFIGVNSIFAILSALLIVILLPRFIHNKRREKFVLEFDRSLIESLTTVSSSLRAGLTLKDSLMVAAKNSPKVFADEVLIALKEYRFGISLEKALDGIRRRVRTQNASIAFGAMIIASQLGGNLPETLQRIVATIRERERVSGKLQSLTAQGRTQSILLCSAPPVIGIFMFFWDPSKIALLTDTMKGQLMLCLAIALEVIGIIVTRKIMKLDI